MWFRFGGPNLMICSGRGGGHDAVRLALLLLRAGRATRVVVVGAEPDDPVATGIHARGRPPAPLRAGAACLVLEHRPARPALEMLVDAVPDPGGALVGAGGLDPVPVWGDCYGAQGIVEVALAAGLAVAGSAPVRVSCGGTPPAQAVLWPELAGTAPRPEAALRPGAAR
jgi:hypothetical protein